MKLIPLTQGQFAIVDDEDYEYLNQWKWCASLRYGNFYAVRNSRNKITKKVDLLMMHNIIMKPEKGLFVDHINHKTLDNRKSELRIATNSQNSMNRSKTHGKSKYKGVYYNTQKQKWIASITINEKKMYLVATKIEEDAAIYYNVAAQLIYKDFACLNKV